jgi:hypothetical protein
MMQINTGLAGGLINILLEGLARTCPHSYYLFCLELVYYEVWKWYCSQWYGVVVRRLYRGVAVNLACLKVLSAVAPYEGHRLLLMVDELSRIVHALPDPKVTVFFL